MKKPPEGGLSSSAETAQFVPEAAPLALMDEPIEPIAEEAAIPAEDAASMAEVAADEAAMPADEAASIGGVLIDGVDIVDGGVVVVVVVDVSSFLLQAAKDTAAASEIISKALFMFLLDHWVRTITGNRGTSCEEPPPQKNGNPATSNPGRRL